jgi:hypothetical protein
VWQFRRYWTLNAGISQGWRNLRRIDTGSDCLLVDDVAHEKLFSRVTAVVHHGGAGTTTALWLCRYRERERRFVPAGVGQNRRSSPIIRCRKAMIEIAHVATVFVT